MRRFENEKKAFKKRYKKGAKFLKRKESTIIAVRKDISLKSIDYLRLTMRRSIILKKNEDEELKKSLN
jgi:hypothetical protein